MTNVTAKSGHAPLTAIASPFLALPPMNAIEVHDLRKSYGELEAVRGVSFDVAAGEVFCLLGPNGAGKTTTVEIMEGYRLADAGSVGVLGHDPARGERALRERVGIVLQQPGVQADLSVGELLEMYARYYPHPRTPDEVIELVELDAKRDERVAEALGRPAPPARPRARADRRPGPAVPRRADDRLRPARAPPGVGGDPLAVLARQDRLPHHPLHGRGAGARRPRRRDGGGRARRHRPAGRARRARRAADRDPLPPARPASSRRTCPSCPAPTVSGRPRRACSSRRPTASRPLHRLTGWALERDVALAGLAVAQPSLEDVYLSLTADHGDPR